MQTATPVKETPAEAKKRNRKVAVATIVGSMLEWYDFYLYATMASIIFARVFFDNSDPNAAGLAAFSTFAIGFIARPFGGIFFGYLGDKLGRKRMLAYTFALMGICTACIGLIPSYDMIGLWAPVLLVIFRIAQGLGAGAELAGAAVTSYEHADESRKGRQGAWPALGLNLGLLLSSLTIYALTMFGDDFLLNGGWRIPFILSFALVFIGVWVRRSLPETPEYAQTNVQEHKRASLKELFATSLPSVIVVFVLAIGYNSLSYIYKTFSLAYLTQFQGVSPSVTSLSVTIASLIAIFAVPTFGWLCDRYSSRAVLVVGGLLAGAFGYPFMALLGTGQDTAVYLALIIGTGVIAPMMFAPQGSFLSRQFPVYIRSTGVGTSREIGTAIAGGLAPLGALTLVANSPTNSTTGVVIILVISGLLVTVAALFDQGYRYSTGKN
ncbi:MFS transporter [Pseudochelatococcus contaminans]|uniref:MFS family permease n=1 Tax=Pseudochelatococcus contaminans TaxID=1538103 RepID=A0A7W6EGW3_9HYPH|nr:MFS transporter [Pseudochelatococcus contaminans]MBB3809734.1 MFS family permease [Pseudochelatococcus contaminans]